MIGTIIVAALEANLATRLDASFSFFDFFLADLALLIPFALAGGSAGGGLMCILEPGRMKTLGEYAEDLRSWPVLARLRMAALVPLLVFASFGWFLTLAHTAHQIFKQPSPMEVGVQLGFLSLAVFLLLLAVAFALYPSLRRVLAWLVQYHQCWVDPTFTGGGAVLLVLGMIGLGIGLGEPNGSSEGLWILGLLKKPAIDWKPLVNGLILATGIYLAPFAFYPVRRRLMTVLPILLITLLPLGVTLHQAHALNQNPSLVIALEEKAPLGGKALALWHRVVTWNREGDSLYHY
ncbi:hypothetical protein [Pajaroellobacter abortibovis]|nr:hypothetical protein [Pajaroellobacter abortibovis]